MTRDLENYLRPGVKGTPFCPGCGHGILMGLILRSIDELKMDMRKMLFVSGIGCAAWIPSPHFAGDTLHTLHGRAVAFATGAKLANPELCVLIISGDGDLSAIGGNHLIHAARRNLDLKVICANNMIYGMTGGQAAPTTPQGARTATTGQGNPYPPFDLCRLVAAAGATYVARYGVTQPQP
jgi:2-oxoglutarate ferredoxin oxidoreductase subunit beta